MAAGPPKWVVFVICKVKTGQLIKANFKNEEGWIVVKKILFGSLIVAFILFSNPGALAGPGAIAGSSAGDLSPVDALQIIDKQVTGLPSSAFNNVQQAGDSKRMLLSSIQELMDKVGQGAYESAIDNLDQNLRHNLQKWLVATEQPNLLTGIDNAVASTKNAAQTTVSTAYGMVAGVADPYVETWVWKGIPYAKPPIGALRWKAPQDPAPWDAIRHSNKNYSPGIQPVENMIWIPTDQLKGSEDCLYLDIYRPKAYASKLPVYFWIHGGGNFQGQASIYWSSLLAMKLKAVVVVIQYRLGPFGFFTHPALHSGGTEIEKSGNFGTLDQIKALQWVQKNITGFGGDPNNVTIAGESAGGFDVLNLMISPLSKGLFHKAVVQSAGCANIPVSRGVDQANVLIDNLLVADGTCADVTRAAAVRASMSNPQIESYLRGKRADQIVRVIMKNAPTSFLKFTYPLIDGVVIPGTPVSVFESGNYNKVPVILGGNEYEMKPFLPTYLGSTPTSSGHTWANVYNVLGLAQPSMTLDEFMPPNGPDRALYERIGKYASLTWKEAMVDSLARILKKHQDNVYCYLFKWGGVGSGSPPFDFLVGAGHAFELPLFFGLPTDIWNAGSVTKTNIQGRYALSEAILSYAGTFTATGNPNRVGSGLPVWEEWSNKAGEPKYISLDADFTRARIGMMNQEVTKTELLAQINALPASERNMITSLSWWWQF
jgi:para-nitrobenzyl esterase